MDESISLRKEEHLRISLDQSVQEPVELGFSALRLEHCALPEVNLEDIDISTTFLGRRLKAPLMISGMTGGTDQAGKVNRHLAIAAEATGIAFCVGSQRAAIVNPQLASTYRVRDVAPDVFLFSNLGAIQLRRGFGIAECQAAIDLIGADGLVLHLNPLQEALQTHGDTTFAGVAEHIAEVCRALTVPVIVKEVGFGISGRVARQLLACGVAAIDVQGAGGTSWARVEGQRAREDRLVRAAEAFRYWGIPTPLCIRSVRRVCPDLPLIAGGGIRTGVDAAKAIALGADLVAAAQPFLQPALDSAEAVIDRIEQIIFELRVALFATGCQQLHDLRYVPITTRYGPFVDD